MDEDHWVDFYTDDDGDGYGDSTSSIEVLVACEGDSSVDGYALDDGDCDDDNPSLPPTAEAVCGDA
ncbi:MAG: hypothetical protein MK239_03925, partial [Gemmatimonadetes bacterium]|nr:hypothetical protein [Gemmatimonadota bacterium]